MRVLRQNLLLGILALLLLAWFWTPSLDNPLDQSAADIDQPEVTTYLVDSRSHVYDESGQLIEILAAERVAHRDPENISELTEPRYYAHDGDNRSWSLVARQGTLRHATEVLLLRRDVLLTNDQSGGTLSTHSMNLHLKRRTALSMVPVMVRWGDNWIRANGMHVDLAAEVIQLEPNVESLYVSTTR